MGSELRFTLLRYVRTKLAAQMQLRMVPEVRFIYDEAAERGEEVCL